MATTSVELVAFADDSLRFYVNAFVAGYASAATRRNYGDDLRFWNEFCTEGCHVDPRLVKRTHVELFARSMEGRELAPASIKRRLATLSSFYRWLVAEEILTHNPVASVRRQKVADESVRIGLGRTELADWLNAAEAAGGYDYGLACLLALNGLHRRDHRSRRGAPGPKPLASHACHHRQGGAACRGCARATHQARARPTRWPAGPTAR